MTQQKTIPQFDLGYLVKKNVPALVQIESSIHRYFDSDFQVWTTRPIAWTEEDFEFFCTEHNVRARVLEVKKAPIGYLVYQAHKDAIEILKIGVDPAHQRKGYGTGMVLWLMHKLERPESRFESIFYHGFEKDLQTARFFASMGFKSSVERGHWSDQSDSWRFDLTKN